ncbi:MAG: hypothetical protein U5K33_01455 [Halofilum sp. (in: g-proteobacteria)]|nr:hypothetical protein [Halofilum sp. (in: g-proteobacteria)]
MRFVGDDEVSDVLLGDARAYIDYLADNIRAIAVGERRAWIKPKVIHEDPVHPRDGDIRAMTCFTDRVKVVKIISTNPVRQKHWSVSVGTTLLLDYEENHPVMQFDAPMMSALRTAGMAVVGTRFAGYGFGDVCIVGNGRVGRCTRDLVERAYPEERVPVMRDRVDGTADDRTRYDNEVVITATTSREPFITADNCQAGFLCSLGADTAFNFELSDDCIRTRGGLYVDCNDAREVGDLARLGEAEVRGDVLEFARTGEGMARTLISVGSPLMDALTVEFLLNHL